MSRRFLILLPAFLLFFFTGYLQSQVPVLRWSNEPVGQGPVGMVFIPVSLPGLSLPEVQRFVHDDIFYDSLAQSIDIVMTPLFRNVEELTPKEQALYFAYFVDREGLYRRGEDWYDPTDEVYRIPVQAISSVLDSYLGVENFDPVAAYGQTRHEVDYAKVPLGFDSSEGVYVTNTISGWGGRRTSRLLEKELLGDDVVRVTVGFFDRKTDETPFKKKVVTLRETPGNRSQYTLLSVVDLQTINGREIVVSGFHGNSPLNLLS